jgi:hypothetical protein
MTALLTALTDLLTDPRIGLPTLLLAAAAIATAVLYPRREPRTIGHEAMTRESDRDSVSRTYLAIQQGRYADVLAETYRRLDRAVYHRTQRTMRELPWGLVAAQQLGIEDPKGLRRTQHDLDTLEWRTRRLEGGSWVRWDFWRSYENAHAHLVAASERLFTRVDEQLVRLEHRAP